MEARHQLYPLTRATDGPISCKLQLKLLWSRFISAIVITRPHIRVLYFPYQHINTSPCAYGGISKPVEKVPSTYVPRGLSFITKTPLFSFTSAFFLSCPFRQTLLHLFSSAFRSTVRRIAFPPVSIQSSGPPRSFHYLQWVFITSRDLMFRFGLRGFNYDNSILEGV